MIFAYCTCVSVITGILTLSISGRETRWTKDCEANKRWRLRLLLLRCCALDDMTLFRLINLCSSYLQPQPLHHCWVQPSALSADLPWHNCADRWLPTHQLNLIQQGPSTHCLRQSEVSKCQKVCCCGCSVLRLYLCPCYRSTGWVYEYGSLAACSSQVKR